MCWPAAIGDTGRPANAYGPSRPNLVLNKCY